MRTALVFTLATILTAATLSTRARADEAASPSTDAPLQAPPSAPAHAWYGWQTLAADGLSAALLSTGLASDASGAQTALTVGGITTYGLGAPIVHAAHGRWVIAGADLALRVGAVVLGGFVGLEVGAATGPSQPCGPAGCSNPIGVATDTASHADNGMAVGAAIGALAASVVDAALLSTDRAPPKDEAAPAFTWSPSLSALPGGASGGLRGTF